MGSGRGPICSGVGGNQIVGQNGEDVHHRGGSRQTAPGVASSLIEHALLMMRKSGMQFAIVETGDDSRHAPSRATDERAGFGAGRSPVTSANSKTS